MKKMRIIVIAAVAVLAIGALGGVTVRAHATGVAAPVAAATVDTTTPAEPDAGLPDTDTVQQGDQSGPDDGTAETAAEPAGSEVTANDGTGGHADEPGDAGADHQFEGVE